MKRFGSILRNKLTVGLLLTIIGSFTYALLLKLFLEHLFDVYPIKGGLDLSDIGYFFSIAFWRFLFDSYLQLVLGEYFHMPIVNVTSQADSLTLFTNRTESSTNNDNSSSDKSKQSEVLDFDKSYELQKEMMSNLRCQWDMMRKLSDLKQLHDLKYYEINGAFELDGPTNLSDSQLNKLANEVGVIDRIINTKVTEYSALEKKFQTTSHFGSDTKKLISDHKETHIKRYRNLFEK